LHRDDGKANEGSGQLETMPGARRRDVYVVPRTAAVDMSLQSGETAAIYSPLDQPSGLWRGFVFVGNPKERAEYAC
jgi:hypothetical protein